MFFSQKPLFRVPIEEIGLETTARPAPSTEQSELAKRITAKEKEEFDKLFTSSKTKSVGIQEVVTGNGSGDPTSSHTSRVNHMKKDVPQENPLSSTNNRHSVGSPSSKYSKSDSSVKPPVSSDKTHVTSAPACPSPAPPPAASTSSPPAASSCNGSGDSSNQPSLPVPQSSFQFQADFKQLKNKPDAFFTYFKVGFSFFQSDHLLNI